MKSSELAKLAGNTIAPGHARPYSAVPDSEELRRILSVPRRDPDARADYLVALLTDALRTPWGKQTLRPRQALACAEGVECGGLLANIVAGGGKTLLTGLAPRLLGSMRPVLFTASSMIAEHRNSLREAQEHWQIVDPETFMIQSYEFLYSPKQGRIYGLPEGFDPHPTDPKKMIEIRTGLVKKLEHVVVQEDFLTRYAPDWVGLDEAQNVKSPQAVARKRLARLHKARPGVPFWGLSATLAKIGVVDYAHLASWCLRQWSPCPREWQALEDWSAALDDKVADRLAPGELARLYDDSERKHAARGDEESQVFAARSAFRRRLVDTPGVVVSQDEKLEGVDLTLEPMDPGQGDLVLEGLFKKLRTLRLTPSDEPVPDGKDEWRHANELALGLHYHPDPPPPVEWLDRRRELGVWARGALSSPRCRNLGIDSFGPLKDAIRVGKVDDGGLLAAWEAVEKTFELRTVPVWHSDEAILTAANWLHSHSRGIVWAEHTFFSERLAEVAGVPYFGPLGLCTKTGLPIREWQGPCIASIDANSTGRNLQWNWDETLIMTFPPSPVTAEQMLARVHRSGQKAAVVRNWVWLGCHEVVAGFWAAVTGAEANATREGGAQRILYANKTMPSLLDVMKRGGARWVK